MKLVLAFLLGLGTAGAWVLYIRAIGQERAMLAALSDLAILVSGSIGVQLWSQRRAFRLFAAYDLGAALGTYLLVHWGLT